MSVRRKIHKNYGTYFITFTNRNWLPLFEITKSYNAVFKFFDYLYGCNHYVNAYVIMPNHVHMVITFSNTTKGINKIVGDGKRFLAYEIVSKLIELNRIDILTELEEAVNSTSRAAGKKHTVFETSFDWKECNTDLFTYQKIDYIHFNPCRGLHQLVKNPLEYLYSSAKDYLLGEPGIYPIHIFERMKDINFETR